ncbi:unnamed protein product [Vitrella brassicaformis CCMP3155]|uniref:Uncharacterized protein n=4 Tax=Vitrella brassicaformis TaxID=1169539 RepID=A0A0G4GHP1_VITBC|nr:unnamed protein product [Vitrella brassicaformis CCMP3155]|eukprot:CEM29149.1 unnamed protein product [Vitrella brassicaformis CCMP3155]
MDRDISPRRRMHDAFEGADELLEELRARQTSERSHRTSEEKTVKRGLAGGADARALVHSTADTLDSANRTASSDLPTAPHAVARSANVPTGQRGTAQRDSGGKGSPIHPFQAKLQRESISPLRPRITSGADTRTNADQRAFTPFRASLERVREQRAPVVPHTVTGGGCGGGDVHPMPAFAPPQPTASFLSVQPPPLGAFHNPPPFTRTPPIPDNAFVRALIEAKSLVGQNGPAPVVAPMQAPPHPLPYPHAAVPLACHPPPAVVEYGPPLFVVPPERPRSPPLSPSAFQADGLPAALSTIREASSSSNVPSRPDLRAASIDRSASHSEMFLKPRVTLPERPACLDEADSDDEDCVLLGRPSYGRHTHLDRFSSPFGEGRNDRRGIPFPEPSSPPTSIDKDQHTVSARFSQIGPNAEPIERHERPSSTSTAAPVIRAGLCSLWDKDFELDFSHPFWQDMAGALAPIGSKLTQAAHWLSPSNWRQRHDEHANGAANRRGATGSEMAGGERRRSRSAGRTRMSESRRDDEIGGREREREDPFVYRHMDHVIRPADPLTPHDNPYMDVIIPEKETRQCPMGMAIGRWL